MADVFYHVEQRQKLGSSAAEGGMHEEQIRSRNHILTLHKNSADKITKLTQQDGSLTANDDQTTATNSDDPNELPEGLEASKITIVIATLFISSLFFMMDNGFMPAASVKFKDEMKMDNAAFGFIGSFVYLG